MIGIEEGLTAILLADPAVKALAGTHLEPLQSTQGTQHPRLTYQRISTPRVRHLRGRSKLAHPRIQVNCFDTTYSGARALALAVVNALDDPGKYQTSAAGWLIQAMTVEDERDHYWNDQQGADIGVYQASVDVIVWHNEA